MPLCMPCPGAALPSAQRDPRAIREQTLASPPPAPPLGRGATRGCAQQMLGSVLVAQLDRWQAPPPPPALLSSHTNYDPVLPTARKA